MLKNIRKQSTTNKLAFVIAISLPVAIFVLGIKGIYETFKAGFTTGLNVELLLPDVFIIVGAIIVFKKIITRIQQRLAEEACEVTNSDSDSHKRPKIDTRESPIWDFSHYPNFPSLGIVVTLAFFTIGSFIFFLPSDGFNMISNQLEARKWPTTTGVVTHSKVLSRNVDVPGFDSYHADIRITYSVAEKEYQLNELYIGQAEIWSDNMSAYQQRNQFRKNQKVKVHYNPTKPEVATADVSFHLFTIVYTGIALACYFMGGLSIYYTLDQLRRFLNSRRDYDD